MKNTYEIVSGILVGFESTSIILDIDSNEKKVVVDENVLQIVSTKVLHHVCIKTCNGVGVEVVEKRKYN